MTRREETVAVKRALVAAGFDKNNLKVKHGTGTAWGWLKVYAEIHHKPECNCEAMYRLCTPCNALWLDCYRRILEVAIKASGRSVFGDDRINIHLGFQESGGV